MKNDIETGAGQAEMAAKPVKVWQTPVVIIGTLDQAQLNVGATDDGDGGATPDNS